MGEFTEQIQERYEDILLMSIVTGGKSKFEFLSQILNFTTYDSEIDELFSVKMIEVLTCIVNKETFKYQEESRENYINYLLMCNMPFLTDKLDWGGSIRGAWFSYDKFEIEGIKIESFELEVFISDLLEWVKETE